MELKNKTKFLLVFGIIFVAFLLFNTNNVNAAEISNYKCKIEKDGYILYNNYFNTKDVTFERSYNRTYITVYNVDKSKFNEILNSKTKENDWLVLVEIGNDVTSVKAQDSQENLEIIELNNKKYVTFKGEVGDSSNTEIFIYGDKNLQITKNSGTEEKYIEYYIDIFNTDYINFKINVVNKNGTVYAGIGISNGNIPNGVGLVSIPKKIDFNETYVEYISNKYVGNAIKDGSYNIPYIGKYGSTYKYKMSLKNVKVNEYGALDIGANVIYNNIKFNDGGAFELDPDYTINNETYVENKKTSTDTKLKFDLQGKFKGTLKAEEVSKNDLVYGKVEDKLNKNSADDLYMWIGNIYIENGSFEGNLKLTFNVGEQYNGKNYFVTHMKNENYEFEEFKGIVKDGKIEITVDSLSPFGISITENKNTDNTISNQEENKDTTKLTETKKGEKDETPKTGIVNIMGYVLLASVLSGLGIVTLKKKIK